MSGLVVCTPRTNCVADVTATEFDLSIVAHGWVVNRSELELLSTRML
jgi:hypothetical protein